jgi:2-polyprenyl-3-methyl-5-hydroxy-6-metoxy-1,4-benzoquinol methylase
VTWLKAGTAEQLLATEVAQHVMRLRELLVRGDENLKAWQLLNSVPYWAQEHPALVRARAEQREMVAHAIDPRAYDTYYATNVHERPFEEQYGIRPEDAHQHLYRVDFLRRHLPTGARVLDLSSNDGWMAQNLHAHDPSISVHCLDLNPGCIARARNRPGVTRAEVANLLDPPNSVPQNAYDAVVLFEVIEHLVDPAQGITAAANYVNDTGALYVSTPLGAVEGLDLPTWAHIEPKGHLHSFRPSDFQDILEQAGDVEALEIGPDRIMVAKVVL